MNVGKALVWTAMILMLINFVAVRSPETVHAVETDKTDQPSLGTLTIGNSIFDAHVENLLGASGVGTYTIETGSAHPDPGENVFYGGEAGNPWSSYNTIHVTDTMRDYVTTTSSPTPDPGYTLVSLDSLSPTVTTPNPTTVTISWTTPENLQIVQINEVLGTAESDTRVRTTMRITNNDNAAHQVGVRYEWDLMINGWDGAWIRPWTDATTPGTWLDTETEWTSPAFHFWETSNIPASLFSVYGGLAQPPDATTPNRLVYAHWFSSYSRAYSYTPTGMVIGSTTPTIGGQYDSAVLYYWNPTTINPGETKTTTAYVTTFLLEQEPPIEDLPEETISNQIQSADANGDGRPDFAWNSGYDISFTSQTLHLEINIQLVGDNPGDALRQQWHDGIEDIWSNAYDLVDGLYTYPIEVAVNWVNADPHHTVTVHSGTGPTNMLMWYTDRPSGWGNEYHDEIAAHEAGHMMGVYDEYAEDFTDTNNNGRYDSGEPFIDSYLPLNNRWDCGALDPNTWLMHTGSLMDNLGFTRPWHYEQILEWLETRSDRDLSLAQSPLPPYPLDDPVPGFNDPQVLAPMHIAEDALAELEVLYGDTGASLILWAKNKVEKSLKDCLWMDDWHLTDEVIFGIFKGARVFRLQAKATSLLEMALKRRRFTDPQKTEIMNIIDKLVECDRKLAQTVIEEGGYPADHRCWRLLSKGDDINAYLKAGGEPTYLKSYTMVITYYLRAWKCAMRG